MATAQQKRDAAMARTSGDGAQKPRDAILLACQAIAAQFRVDGFSFVKTGPMLRRAHNWRVFKVVFQSDRNNIVGTRAAVWIHPIVDEVGSGLRVAGSQIGNLAGRGWMEWDFAGEASRDHEIADAVSAIGRYILPFFATFETVQNE